MTNNKQQTAVDFVPYELALELKQLGFDEPCLGYYIANTLFISNDIVYNSTDIPVIKAPLYSQAFRWFRDKYKLKCCIIPLVCEQGFSDLYESRIHQEKHSILRIGNYKTYEEAELACLKKLIEQTYGGGDK
jgi:hypothetical protein